MFLNKPDLTANAYPEIIAAISRYSDEGVMVHCQTAESELETYLGQLYDIRPELEKTGTARHKLLLQLSVNIAIYYLYGNQETIPTKVDKAYERSLKTLEMLANGKIKLAGVAPAPIPEEPVVGGQVTFSSNPRRPPLDL
ncbi:DUF1320 domain-containing protein [Fibrisoma montanum]|uniref:DUF1320 domain-containing protein n=1 Tax=Fibrisoma montanum TaxID=2305895 RepID=A0A418M6K0_9BACT|nr:phage protein Gp36 family protein [Fibrisoma montanum]RIV21385.1 DUF1320 domain-containing protein [Fibrisoma montanum]